MWSLGLALCLSAATPRAAHLLPPAEAVALLDELSTTEALIKQHRPELPRGFLVGMAFGFSFAVVLLPGLPLLVAGLAGPSFLAGSVLLVGAVLTAIGGVGLVAAVLCAVLGLSAEAELRATRERLVQRRQALERQLEEVRAVPPPWRPGVERPGPLPTVRLARF